MPSDGVERRKSTSPFSLTDKHAASIRTTEFTFPPDCSVCSAGVVGG